MQRHPEWFAAYVDNKGAGAARITSTKVSRSVGGQEIPTTYVEGVKVVPAQASFTKFVRLAPQYFEAIQKDVPLEVRLETRFRCERGLDEPFLVKIACGAVPSYRNSHPTHDRARMPSETLRIFPLAQRAGRRGRLRSAPPGPPPDSFARPHLPGALGVPR